ncbi:FAD-binding oxidoreductase, partial [Pseudomonas sp. F1002]|uniref:FAD-binding oxidoreductase n=1 Tax=Pseudomonas sp. F1002 TaxID=2738821 RepID=UPI0015A42E43
VVSFAYMTQIVAVNLTDRTAVWQPGVVTKQLQNVAEEKGLYYPVDFASSGSSQIGGNIGTNAGGIKVIRYGMTRNWVAGMKVVTGKGDLLELNKDLIKNATGYDMRQLFIGAEGTLGFVVEATMRLDRAPKNLTAMVLGTTDFDSIMPVLHAFQSKLDLTAFEFFSDKALAKVLGRGD